MSQSHETIELNIETILTLDDQNEPQAITVSGTGNIPRSAVRAIAEEALESFTGKVLHEYRVQMSPVEESEEGTVFEIYKKLTFGTRPRAPMSAAE